jgi:Lysylphosphatidylglycerol synthase TM region
MARTIRKGGVVLYAALIMALYVGALIYFDRRGGVFSSAAELGAALIPVATLSVVAFVVRYLRWSWLLARRGSGVSFVAGFLAYLAGFALTASPGKVGELIRIRYFNDLGVPADRIIACLISERLADIVVLLALSMFLVGAAGFWVASGFAVAAIVTVLVMLEVVRFWHWPAYWLRQAGWRVTARYLRLVGHGIASVRPFLHPLDLGVSLAFGLVVYGLYSASLLLGNYSLASFHLGAETGGGSGTVVTDPPLITPPHG